MEFNQAFVKQFVATGKNIHGEKLNKTQMLFAKRVVENNGKVISTFAEMKKDYPYIQGQVKHIDTEINKGDFLFIMCADGKIVAENIKTQIIF